jgi:hypothetical protein
MREKYYDDPPEGRNWELPYSQGYPSEKELHDDRYHHVAYHEIERCPKCGKWTCHICWRREKQCCKNCLPEWMKQVEREQERERERNDQIRRAEHEESRRYWREKERKANEEEQAQKLKRQQEIGREKKCHICGKLGNDESKRCSRCDKWTCSEDIYREICRWCG